MRSGAGKMIRAAGGACCGAAAVATWKWLWCTGRSTETGRCPKESCDAESIRWSPSAAKCRGTGIAAVAGQRLSIEHYDTAAGPKAV
jgi:hypothetical protein